MRELSILFVIFMSVMSLPAWAKDAFICSGRMGSFEITLVGGNILASSGGKSCLLTENKEFKNEERGSFQVLGAYDADEYKAIQSYDLPSLVDPTDYLHFQVKNKSKETEQCPELFGSKKKFLYLYVQEKFKSVINVFESGQGAWHQLYINQCDIKVTAPLI